MTEPVSDSAPDTPPRSAAGGEAEPGRIEKLLDAVIAAGGGDKVSIGDAVEAAGHGSFGALLVIPSLVLVSPLSGIPGVPTAFGLVIVLVCLQYLAGRDRVWLPARLGRVGIPRARLEAAFRRIRPGVRVLDRIVRPRLTFLVSRTFRVAFAIVCAALALTFPPFEVLPFVATTTASVIALFGLAILAQDGLLGIAALAAAAAAVVAAIYIVVPAIGALFG